MSQTVQGNISKDIISSVAIISLIFTASIYLPIIGFFCSLFIPLPIIYYRSKLGRKIGILVGIGSIILMVFLLGSLSVDILFFAELLLLGFVLSELNGMHLSIEKTILYACSVVLSTGLIILLFYSVNISGKGIYTLISEYITKNLNLTMAMYENMGVSEENLIMLSNSLENIKYVLVRIIPAISIAFTLFVSWTNMLIARPLFKAKNMHFPDFGSLNKWKAPEFMVWFLIGSGALLILSDKGLKILGLNGLIITMTVYFFHGIAIVSYFFEKKNVPRFFRIFLYSIIALQQLVLILVIVLGFFDLWFDFRKFAQKNNN